MIKIILTPDPGKQAGNPTSIVLQDQPAFNMTLPAGAKHEKKKDILCVVDFSPSSTDALKWAAEVARKNQAKLTIMFCYRLIPAYDDDATQDLKRKIEQEAIMKFKAMENEDLKRLTGQYTFLAEVGFYHFRMEQFLRTNPVGLVVVGNSIVQNFDENKNLGFTQFLKSSSVPVVVVPEA